jgi:hypothetical protein
VSFPEEDSVMSFNDPFSRTAVSLVAFPLLFQSALMGIAWGEGDVGWLMVAKRVFLLLPASAVVVACWATVVSVLSIPIRSARQEFITALFVTWWDLGKSVLSFWGGLFRCAVEVMLAAFAVVRVAAFAAWALVHDIVLLPFAFLRHVAGNVVRSPIPWIAVSLTLVWCAIETTIFTYVMSPVVIDTFSNITGETLKESFVRVPLLLFLFFVVLGSYAVLSTFVDAIKSKSVQQIAGIVVIECVVIFVEVMFLYREFVDSLVPWFAQYSSNFELGIYGTIAVACFAWFGIRSLSWFLFAAHGTPTIMAVIQGRGVESREFAATPRARIFEMSEAYWTRTQQDAAWMRQRSETLLSSFMLPPLQIVAAAINFCTLGLLNKHLFSLPFEGMNAIGYSEKLIRDFKKRSGFHAPSPSAAGLQKARRLDPEVDTESMTVTAGRS